MNAVRTSAVLSAFILIALVGSSPMRAMEPPTETTIVLAHEMELARLLDLCADRLGVRVHYDPAQLGAGGTGLKVRTPISGPLSDSELWQTTHALLASRGFTTVHVDDSGAFWVIAISEAAKTAIPVEQATYAAQSPRPGFNSILIRAHHVSPKALVDGLQHLIGKAPAIGGTSAGSGAVVALADSGVIMLSDLEMRMPMLLASVRQLDAPRLSDGDLVLRRLDLSLLTAAQAAAMIEQVAAKRELAGAAAIGGEVIPLAGTPGGQGESLLYVGPRASLAAWEALILELDQAPRDGRTSAYSLHGFGANEVRRVIEQAVGVLPGHHAMTIAEDSLSGALIITADPAAHRAIEQVLERLRSAPAADRRPLRSIPVRNRNVDELLEVLDRLIAGGALNADDGPLSAPSETRTPQRVQEAVTPEKNVAPRAGRQVGGDGWFLTADDTTNTLIVIGEPRQVERLEALVRSLDVLQPQVLIEATMVSLSESDSRNLGVELERLELSGGTAIKLASLFGLSTAATGTSGPLGIGRAAAGNGITGLILDPGEFSVVVRALQSVTSGRTMSQPRLLVNNNQDAVFDSVLQQPFVSTNASDTVATTSFGGFESAGTQLTITPQIANGDHLVVQYSLVQSAFVGSPSSAGIPPPRQQTNVESVATIPEGCTIVIGGLEQEQAGTSRDSVPFIDEVPLVGELFKNRSRTLNRSRFFIFITATVMRDVQFRVLKDRSAATAAGAEIDDGWPDLIPRAIP